MLIVSRRYHKLRLSKRIDPIWEDEVYYLLLALKRFWRSQGIKIF